MVIREDQEGKEEGTKEQDNHSRRTKSIKELSLDPELELFCLSFVEEYYIFRTVDNLNGEALQRHLQLLYAKTLHAYSLLGFPHTPGEHWGYFPINLLVRMFGQFGNRPLVTSLGRCFKLLQSLNQKQSQCVLLVQETSAQVTSYKVLKVRPRTEFEVSHDRCLLFEEFELQARLKGKHNVLAVEELFAIELTCNGEKEILDVIVFPYFKTCHQSSVPFSYPQFWTYIRKLFEAIAWCHANEIIHVDIKPDNVLFIFDGEDKKSLDVKLIDFGSACTIDSSETVEQETGTIMFSSPEMFTEMCFSKPRDIWAVGILIMRVVYETVPFQWGEDDLSQIYEASLDFVQSAHDVGDKPWPFLCKTHPPEFDCALSSENNGQCTKVQQLLRSVLEIDPLKRITAHDAIEALQSIFDRPEQNKNVS